MTDLCKERCCDVAYFVMSYRGKSSHVADYCMIHREHGSAVAGVRGVTEAPPISRA